MNRPMPLGCREEREFHHAPDIRITRFTFDKVVTFYVFEPPMPFGGWAACWIKRGDDSRWHIECNGLPLSPEHAVAAATAIGHATETLLFMGEETRHVTN